MKIQRGLSRYSTICQRKRWLHFPIHLFPLLLHALYLLTIKTKEMHNFSNLFDKVFYMLRIGPLSIIRSISTLYTQQQVFVMLVLLAVC